MTTQVAESKPTVEQVVRAIHELAPTNRFAASLKRQLGQMRDGDRGLSPKQWECAQRMAAEHLERQRQPARPTQAARQTIPLGNFERIVAIFQTAAVKLRCPKVHLDLDGDELVLWIAGPRARQPGTVSVIRQPQDQWVGRITRAGALEAGPDATPDAIELLKAFAADPAQAAAEHGRRTGSCCFCRRELTDERSVSVGYGPTCAETFGLPWGG